SVWVLTVTIGASVAIAAPASSARADEEELTLARCVALALARNPRVAAARHSLAAARAGAAAVTAALGPQLNLDAFARVQVPYDAQLQALPAAPTQLQQTLGYGAQLTLTQPVTGLLGIGHSAAAADRHTDAVRWRAEGERLDVQAEVEETFWRH